MALDHFVPQAHLRNFYMAARPHLLSATRKSDLKNFLCRSEDVCRIEEGNTNPYLKEPRLIEEFLRDVEPLYNSAIAKLCSAELDQKSVYAIAGFVAYINNCAPAATRSHSSSLKAQLKTTAELLEARGEIERSPLNWGPKRSPS